jgi:hypothetical protein
LQSLHAGSERGQAGERQESTTVLRADLQVVDSRRPSTFLIKPLHKTHHLSFLNVSYVCPEPVLAKLSLVSIKWLCKRRFFAHRVDTNRSGLLHRLRVVVRAEDVRVPAVNIIIISLIIIIIYLIKSRQSIDAMS